MQKIYEFFNKTLKELKKYKERKPYTVFMSQKK